MMLNNCQQRLSALERSQESLSQSTRDLGNFLVSIVDPQKNKHEQLKEHVSDLTKSIDDRVKNFEQASVSLHHVIDDFNKELESLSIKKAAQTKLISLIQEELEHLAREHTGVKVPEQEVIESKVNRLKAEDEMFKEQLGVQLNKIKGGYLQVVLSHINQRNPQSLFMFSLKLGEDRKYVVTDCKPPIADLDDIVKTLNSDNDFHKFMHTVRRRFKDEAEKEK